MNKLTLVFPCLVALAGCDDFSLTPGDDVAAKIESVRDRRGSTREPLTVKVKPGVYFLPETLRLGEGDSGLAFVAEKEGTAVFSGGRTLGAFRDTGKGWWEADANGLKDIQQLYVNGRMALPATSPNEGYYYVKDAADGCKDAFTADAADIAPLKGLSKAELARVRVPLYQSWDMGVSVLTNFDAAANALAVSPGCTRPILFWNKFRPRFKLQNLRAALDAPGEWFQDGDRILYVPRKGETPESSVAVAAVTEKLLDIEGATNVTFRGIAFAHARLQVDGRGFFNCQAQIRLPAAVETHDSSGLVFDRCRFSQLGPHALWLARGTDDSRVTHCLFEDLGAGGVYVGSTEYDKANLKAYANRILVRDNIIREGGRIADGAHGVWLGHTADVTVEHNEIADFHYTGIASGWRWGYAPTPTRRIRIAWNHVHHIGNGILSDMAAIYTLGEHEGSAIVGNRIHDVWCYGQAGRGGRGIYTDEGSAHITIASNLVYNISSGQITQHYGKDNLFVNNIFAFSRGTGEMIYHAKIEKHHSFTFDHNIIIWEGAREAVHSWDGYDAKRALTDVTFDRNLWWRIDGDAAADEFNHVSYAEWKALGADPHGKVADPKFVDAKNLNFDLRSDSPACEMGFVPWDWRAAGVTGEPEWKALAKRDYYAEPKVPAAPLYVPKAKERPIAATLHVATHEFDIREKELPLAKAAGIATVRNGFYLGMARRTDGGWDFSRADAALATCEKNGIEWLPILIQPGHPTAQENPGLWREYVQEMARHFKGRIRTWEVWNEQNLKHFWVTDPSVKEYYEVLKAAYEEIKAVDPSLQVAVGGYAGVPFGLIEELYKLGGGKYFDIMNVHPYCYPGAPEEALTERVTRLRKLMAKYGDEKKPIWFTEIGWPTPKVKIESVDVLLQALRRIDVKKSDWKIVFTDESVTGSLKGVFEPLLPGATISEVSMGEFPEWLAQNKPDVVVFPFGGRYDRRALAAVEKDLLPRGGVLACLSRVPLCFSCTSDGKGNVLEDDDNAGFKDRPRLGIELMSEHTDKRIPKSVRLANGRTAERFFGASRKPGVQFVPFEGYHAATNGVKLAAAGLYRIDGGKAGTIVVSGLPEHTAHTSTEAQQAEILPRSIVTALHLGVDRYFIYEFQAVEKDDYEKESHFGIVHRDLSPKPAYEALKVFHSFRPDGSKDSQGWTPWKTSGGTYAFQWISPKDGLTGMIWNPTKPGTKRLKFLTGNVRFFDMRGEPLAVCADANGRVELEIGKSPVYYRGSEFTAEKGDVE